MQNALWHDTIYDAIGSDIAAAGGFKVVAGKLWPNTDPSTGATKLRNAINPDQAQKLCPDELLAIKRFAQQVNSSATVHYEAQQLGYVCTWVDPEDEADAIRRELRDELKSLNKKFERLERTEQRAQMRAVK